MSTLVALIALLFGSPKPVPQQGAVALAYRWTVGQSARYKLRADIKGSIPLFESPEPVALNAVITMVYRATPKVLLADGSADLELRVESAEIEIEKIPFPIPLEEAQKLLDQNVTFAKTGEVLKVGAGEALPFSVTIPGVDPKRLYTLLYPVVFPTTAVKPGESWDFKSQLLGGQGAEPKFTAKLLGGAAQTLVNRISQKFVMNVNQSVDSEKKPVTDAALAHRTVTGKIEGSGEFRFDRAKGRMVSGVVDLNARISDDLVGKPMKEDEPKQVLSTVSAHVKIDLQVAAAKPPAKKEK